LIVCTPAVAGAEAVLFSAAPAVVVPGVAAIGPEATGCSINGFFDAQPIRPGAKKTHSMPASSAGLRSWKKDSIRIGEVSIELSKFNKRYMIKQITLI
jgi:hypothetical protein